MKSHFVLFDLDGTLIDSVPALYGAFEDWVRALPIYSGDLIPDTFNGMSSFEIVEQVRLRYKLTIPLALMESSYFSRLRLAYQGIAPVEGADDLLRTLRQRDVAIGLVTAASAELVTPLIERLGWDSIFAVRQTGERGQPCKPDPFPYRMATARMGLAFNDGAVIEDSPSGVMSAHLAGLRVIGFSQSVPAADLIAAGAGQVVSRLSEVEVLL
jgi:beta-phosphoglucomutase